MSPPEICLVCLATEPVWQWAMLAAVLALVWARMWVQDSEQRFEWRSDGELKECDCAEAAQV